MCEFYYESCHQPECVAAAKQRLEDARATGDRSKAMALSDEYYTGRSGYTLFLWKGESQPCEHMVADHGPECEIFVPEERSCNCERDGEAWLYW